MCITQSYLPIYSSKLVSARCVLPSICLHVPKRQISVSKKLLERRSAAFRLDLTPVNPHGSATAYKCLPICLFQIGLLSKQVQEAQGVSALRKWGLA